MYETLCLSALPEGESAYVTQVNALRRSDADGVVLERQAQGAPARAVAT